ADECCRSFADKPLHRCCARAVCSDERVRASDWLSGDATALVSWLFAITSDPRWAGRNHVHRMDISREEIAMRCAYLSRHGLYAFRMEHAQRRVHLESEELS